MKGKCILLFYSDKKAIQKLLYVSHTHDSLRFGGDMKAPLHQDMDRDIAAQTATKAF